MSKHNTIEPIDKETGEILMRAVQLEILERSPPFWKTPWNHDTDAAAANVALVCNDPTRTQQQFAEEADINNILRKFMQTGEPPRGNPNMAYMDITEEKDLQDSIVTQYEVEQAWNALPAAIRNILKDPKTFADYVDHCVSTGDIEPLRELGLAPKQSVPEPRSPEDPPKEPTPAPKAPTGGKTEPPSDK